jgi:hypothetical protein
LFSSVKAISVRAAPKKEDSFRPLRPGENVRRIELLAILAIACGVDTELLERILAGGT